MEYEGVQILVRDVPRNHQGFKALYQAQRRYPGVDPVAGVRMLAPMPPESQRVIDDAINLVGAQRMSIIPAMYEANLTRQIPNWLGTLNLSRMRRGRTGNASVGMHPEARGERSKRDLGIEDFPFPCVWQNFSFPIRELAASDRVGESLDTSAIIDGGLNVNEALEKLAISGLGFKVHNGATLYGIANHPNNTVIPISKKWSDPTITGEEVLADVRQMLDAERINGNYGPFDIMVPPDWYLQLTDDYKAASDKLIIERIEQIPAGGRTIKVRSADYMTDVAAMVQMTVDKVLLSIGTEPAPITWSDNSGLHEEGMVLGAIILQIFSDDQGNTGIVTVSEEE